MLDTTLQNEVSIESKEINTTKTIFPVSTAVLQDIEKDLATWLRMANWLQATLVVLGIFAIGCSLFITAFAGSEFLGKNNFAIRVLAFATTLCLTLITSFNLSTKANNCRNAWRHLNKALYSYKSKRIDGDTLIIAYEEGENILGSVDFNYNNEKVKSK